MLTPDQFRVNEAWIVVKVNENENFLFIEDEPHNVYALMDAASVYVFGDVVLSRADEAPHENDVELCFKQAWKEKNQWAEKLILTGDSISENVFGAQAKKNGLLVETVPLSRLGPIVDPLKELFASHFTGEEDAT